MVTFSPDSDSHQSGSHLTLYSAAKQQIFTNIVWDCKSLNIAQPYSSFESSVRAIRRNPMGSFECHFSRAIKINSNLWFCWTSTNHFRSIKWCDSVEQFSVKSHQLLFRRQALVTEQPLRIFRLTSTLQLYSPSFYAFSLKTCRMRELFMNVLNKKRKKENEF